MSELEECYSALQKIAKSYVKKSIDGRELTPKQARAVAITKASTESPAGRQIARRIIQLEKQQAASFAYSVPVAASMGAFRKQVEANDDDELLQELEEIRARADKIRDELLSRGYEEED